MNINEKREFVSFEKVNPGHPDKIADRIAGALVDYCYSKSSRPQCAFEVLIGHGNALIIGETSVTIPEKFVIETTVRISEQPGLSVKYVEKCQDPELAKNQADRIRCGDNGIFKGNPTTETQKTLAAISDYFWKKYGKDGKYILTKRAEQTYELIVCQSWADTSELGKDCICIAEKLGITLGYTINPLGDWTGGIDVDSGATNRKLGSDMGDGVTGGGLMGKDLSKADVSINILCNIIAERYGEEITCHCAIGDEYVDFYRDNGQVLVMSMTYSRVVDVAKNYIAARQGFERFAEQGIIYNKNGDEGQCGGLITLAGVVCTA